MHVCVSVCVGGMLTVQPSHDGPRSLGASASFLSDFGKSIKYYTAHTHSQIFTHINTKTNADINRQERLVRVIQ